ncbi:hypothetical protein Maq22A_1p37775 (plasmid) [Methylobacterium aquaticum]|uniref:Uncharacterized protein n=2 Tax=Methylobacterium TaxID=407 RepID=A0A0C6FN23_9HYPH|nr:hypothetical protein Maq22A_1p37775 [Methylobacterium aquaticum]
MAPHIRPTEAPSSVQVLPARRRRRDPPRRCRQRRRPAAPRRPAAGLHPRPGLHLDRLLRRPAHRLHLHRPPAHHHARQRPDPDQHDRQRRDPAPPAVGAQRAGRPRQHRRRLRLQLPVHAGLGLRGRRPGRLGLERHPQEHLLPRPAARREQRLLGPERLPSGAVLARHRRRPRRLRLRPRLRLRHGRLRLWRRRLPRQLLHHRRRQPAARAGLYRPLQRPRDRLRLWRRHRVRPADRLDLLALQRPQPDRREVRGGDGEGRVPALRPRQPQRAGEQHRPRGEQRRRRPAARLLHLALPHRGQPRARRLQLQVQRPLIRPDRLSRYGGPGTGLPLFTAAGRIARRPFSLSAESTMDEEPGATARTPLLRRAVPDDAPALADLIGQLAAHHGDRATTDAAALRADLFGPSP